MRSTLVDDPEAARAAGWDRLVPPDNLFHSAGWLAIDAKAADGAPRYVLTRDGADERLVSALSCYPLAPDSAPWPFLRPDLFVHRVAELRGVPMSPELSGAAAGLLPGLACGGRRVSDSRLLVADGLTDRQRADATDAALAAAERLARDTGAESMAFLFVDDSDGELRARLAAHGYRAFRSDRECVLDLPDGEFADYVARFSSHRRRHIRRERQAVADAGIRYAYLPADRVDLDVLLPMETQVLEKYGHAVDREQLRTKHLQMAAAFPGDVGYLVALDPDGRQIAFAQCVRRGDTLHPRTLGIDYSVHPGLPLYFDLVYYATTEYAIGQRLRKIEYSIEAEEAKIGRGCRPTQKHTYVKPLSATAERHLARVLAALEPDRSDGAADDRPAGPAPAARS
ncbi:peptidogalycan biosysnthesis protein [Kitasatospora purpeofusca]|uniref:GNAT family N-acetyltransferase n=1 Tax=Kitasatospora purpeofusca TaxID=67352 RepID=A0ABZ1U5S4_9ACTN|nr:peptidogalycan biosysnthesis protein [Kitasatospora purpeofusca]